MKILMRADTHVNIEVPGNAPVAKCTFTQVSAIDRASIPERLSATLLTVAATLDYEYAAAHTPDGGHLALGLTTDRPFVSHVARKAIPVSPRERASRVSPLARHSAPFPWNAR